MERVNMINVIPESASLAEGAFYVIESVETTYNAMWREIGLSELSTLEETGSMVVYESEDAAEKTKKTFIDWIHEFWAKFKGLVNKFLEEVKKLADNAKSKLNALGTKTKESVKKRLDKKVAGQGLKYGKTYGKTYEWTGYDKAVNFDGPIWNSISAFDSWFSKTYSSMNAYRSDVASVKAGLNMAKSVAFKNLGVTKDGSVGDVQAAVLKTIRGDEVAIDDKYIRDNFDDMWEIATDFGKTSASVKKILNGSKKSFDDAAKKIAKFNKKDKEADMKLLMQGIKESRSILVHIGNATLRAIRERMTISIRVVLRVSMLAKAMEEKEAKKAVGESTQMGSDIAAQITGLFA